MNDPWFMHFLRFFLLAIAYGIAGVLIVPALVWVFFMLRHTGRRGRDILLMMLPIVSLVILLQTLWRASAKHVYWATRPEYTSKALFA